MHFTDEFMDEWAEALELDQRLAREKVQREAQQIADEAEALERRQATCEHDWDREAGGGQVGYNGAFEILDVCYKCGATHRTGKWTSVL